MSESVAALPPTLLTTPQSGGCGDCQPDVWWATAQAATVTPGLMRLRAAWGSSGELWCFLCCQDNSGWGGRGQTLALPPAPGPPRPPRPIQLMNRRMECLPPLSRPTVMHWGRVSVSRDETGRILAKWSSLYYLVIIRLIYGWILSALGKFHKASQRVQVLVLV